MTKLIIILAVLVIVGAYLWVYHEMKSAPDEEECKHD